MTATVELVLYKAGMLYSSEWKSHDLVLARKLMDTVLKQEERDNYARLVVVTKTKSLGTYFSYSTQWSAQEANAANALLRELELVAAIAGDEGSDEPFSVTTEVELPV